ncbi:MAG: DUF2202 domain-containing protein [Candidatus Hinthialibacter sp.]
MIGEISDAEADSLVFMLEEEKMARDVYIAMYEKWRNPIFSNIANAEQNHMDAIQRLIDAYDLDVSTQDLVGFTNTELQTLYYDQLIANGAVSELEALKVGAYIEEVDIKDLKDALSITTSSSIQRVYQNLLAGSENHLRAFVRNIEFQGAPYQAQFMDLNEVDQILSSTNMNQGNRGRRGNGQGQGLGQGQGQRQGQGQSRSLRGNWANRNAERSQNRAFIDENGDGICDLTGMAIHSNQKNNRQRGSQSARRGR